MPELTTGQALNKALSLILEQNSTAFIAGEDIGIYGGAFGVTDGLLAQFGDERIKDTPISEDVIAGLAVGASMTGGMPIVEMQLVILLSMPWIQLLIKLQNSLYVWRVCKCSNNR